MPMCLAPHGQWSFCLPDPVVAEAVAEDPSDWILFAATPVSPAPLDEAA